MAAPSHRRHSVGDAPTLPPAITYESVPGRWGYWTATIETSAGCVSVTGPSLHETREALESKLRELRRGQMHEVRPPIRSNRFEDCA